ncbi:MAG: hypothetical protein AB7F59_09850 [Bdellovibrionales bacterium]
MRSSGRTINGLLLSLSLLTVLTSCTHKGERKPASQAQQQENDEVQLGFFGQDDRLQAIQKAQLIQRRPMGSINIVKGPEQKAGKKNVLRFNDRVTCQFTKPGSEMGGATPKYKCVITKIERDGKAVTVLPNDEVKVKFGKDNLEIYAEPAATRLFWAMGFFADTVIPVTVICENCPKDPAKDKDPAVGQTRAEEIALIERKFSGETMEQFNMEDQGWTWREFGLNTKNAAATKDALSLLAAFVGHGDNKPPQQRLVCSKNKIKVDATNKKTTCADPKMFIQDLGSTLGGAGKFTTETAKMNLKHWANKPDHTIWKDSAKCEARLSKSMSAKDGIGDPVISEEGRRYLGALLCQLSTQQIHDLFKVARVEQMPVSDEGTAFATNSIDNWVRVFKEKREQIVDRPECTWNKKPKTAKPFDAKTCQELVARTHGVNAP